MGGGGVNAVEKLRGGCPLQAETGSRRCCYEAGLSGFKRHDRVLER